MNFLFRLSIKNIKNKRMRTLMVYFTILIATFLLSLILISANGIVNLNNEIVVSNNVNYHARINNLDNDTIENLRNEQLIEAMLTSVNIAKVETDNVNAYIVYNEVQKEGIYQPKCELGAYPIKENEIACSEDLLNLLNIPVEVGTQFKLSYRVNNQGEIQKDEFILSGILEDTVKYNKDTRLSLYSYSFFASKDFFDEQLKTNNFNIMTAIRIETTSNINYDTLNGYINQIEQKYSINSDTMIKNTDYLKSTTEAGKETLLLTFCISILIVFFSSAVLYCVYSALTILDIQDIGKYRVIGADYNQIKKMMYLENLVITMIGIFTGIVLSYIISWTGLHILYSKFENISFPQLMTPQIIIIIITTISVGAFISLRPVIHNSLSISPIAALNFNYYGNIKMGARKSYRTISINRLVKLDLTHNKRNVIVSIVSMGLGCIFLIAAAALLESVNIDNVVKSSLPEGDFIIKYDYTYDDKEYAQNNLNSKQMTGIMQNIESNYLGITGVENINRLQLSLGDISYPNTAFDGKRMTIGTFSENDINYLDNNIDKGKAVYEVKAEKPGIIYTWGHAFEKNGFQIGDEISVSFLVGNNVITKKFVLMGSINTMEEGTFLIPDKVMQKIFDDNDATYALAIDTNESNYYDVKKLLTETAKSNDLSLVCKDEEITYAKEKLAMIKYPTILLCTFIGIIGFVNVINTMVVSMIKRRKEISLYRCLGLTNKQLFMMLFKETSVLMLGVILLAFPLGNLCGFMLVQFAKQNNWIGVVSYCPPYSTMVVLFIIIFAITFIMTFFIKKFLMAKSAIEQLRTSD